MANPLLRQLPASRRIFLPVVQERALPVDAEWKCQRSGDCCTKPAEVLMTKEEMRLLVLHAPKEISLHFRPTDDEKFVAMRAGPCPLFVFGGCLVYAHRPFNCRRFACMRPDPKSEPWAFTADGRCANLMRRIVESRVARRLAFLIQRRSQKWARAHGWSESDE